MTSAFFPGRITREQTIWCWYIRNPDSPQAVLIRKYRVVGDDCAQHHSEAGPVAARAKQDGWKRIGRYGYTCPACQRAMRRVPGGAWLAQVSDAE